MAGKPDQGLKIGQAAKLLELEPYVLRFWEDEFPTLRPSRTPRGQRIYAERDLDHLRRIKNLLYDRGMTIEAVRKHLEEKQTGGEILDYIARELTDIRDLLRNPSPEDTA